MRIKYDELLKPYLSLFSGCGSPLVCFDSTLKCVWESGGVFSVGDDLMPYLTEPVPDPMHEMTEATVYRNDKFYCCRIMPVKNDAGESDAYICELLDKDGLRGIAERSDAVSNILPLYSAVEYNAASVWKSAEKLRTGLLESRSFESLSDVLEIEKSMSNIFAVCGNAFEYISMMSGRGSVVRIDAGALCRSLVDRCNAALAKCGRRIEPLIELEDLTICADSRRTVVALVNAVQNALLYSPRDTEPIMAVYRREKHGRFFVEIRISNENIMFTSKDFKDRVDIDFSYQRLGCGIPIIKAFAKQCGGSFSMEDEGGRVVVTLTLPAAAPEPGSILTFRSPEFLVYSSGVPDFTEIMMREVVQFFGEKEETHS